MSDVRWEDPPPDGRHKNTFGRSDRTAEIRRQLIENPGKWAVLAQAQTFGPLTSRQRRVKQSMDGWRGYRWEAVIRKADDVVKLYVRCLGPADGAS